MNNKFAVWFSVLTSSLLMVLILFVGWLQWVDGVYYNPPMNLEKSVLSTEKSTYKPGEIVKAKLVYVKNRNLPESMVWQFVHNIVWNMPAKKEDLPVGRHEMLIEIGHVPPGSQLGQASFEGLISYQVNIMNKITYFVQTTTFDVVQ